MENRLTYCREVLHTRDGSSALFRSFDSGQKESVSKNDSLLLDFDFFTFFNKQVL